MKKQETQKCKKCLYEWISRKEKPRQCPNCKRQIKYLLSPSTPDKK